MKTKWNNNALTVPFEKSKTFSFVSSIIKNIVSLSALFRFPVELICFIDFGSASCFCCLLKSVAVYL